MIFVDTGAWVALSDKSDKEHIRSLEVLTEISKGRYGRMVTSDYVLDETYTLLRMRGGIHTARRFHDMMTKSSNLQLLWVSEHDFNLAVETMLTHEDKRWSLTDCTSFGIMQELGIRNAFALDNNFRERGFLTYPE